ncbi:MAG: phage tail protein [Proteobacteria bacterium]|nr:phage tail protein [Pseudomonadota bacterium]MBU4295146.1 phage tail protein [Pseudomonadota bacterium]MCG2747010.1 phage tail protein [Desulfobulbaceae bacterium]
MARVTPYGAFNFQVSLGEGSRDAAQIIGGFSDVSGLGTEITVAEYRNGNEKENHVRKVPGVYKVSDVTLKRGIVNSEDLWAWITAVQQTGYKGQRTVHIKLMDETGDTEVQGWTLNNAVPTKYTGPTLAAKGGGDVAMEELVLASESIQFEQLSRD